MQTDQSPEKVKKDSPGQRRPIYRNPWVLVGLMILLLIVLSLLELARRGIVEREVPTGVDTIRQRADTIAIIPETMQPAEEPPSSMPGRPKGAAMEAKPYIETLPGRVDSWADWNASFTDTSTHTYSAIFDSAHIQGRGNRIEFSSSGRSQDLLAVKSVFCRVSAVTALTKYTFPGVSVDFSVKPGFVASVFLRGHLRPREGSYGLTIESVRNSGGSAAAQFIALFKSPPGYAYVLQLGIECAAGGIPVSTRVFYSPPLSVEFPRMESYTSLFSGVGDTVLMVSNNARSISEVAGVLPGSIVAAVFVPVEDGSEAEEVHAEDFANLQLHVSAPGELDESFILLDASRVLIEEKDLDPGFKRMALLCVKEDQMEQIGYPRVTHFVRSTSAALRLRLKFNQYLRK